MPTELQYNNIQLYAQVGCKQTDETVAGKKAWGLAIVCIGIWMLWYFRITMKNVQMLDLINEKLFDLKLITADDYSIKISIKDSMVETQRQKWQAKKDQETNEEESKKKFDENKSFIHAFEADLVAEIRQVLMTEGGLSEERTEVADLQFGFENARLLLLLEQRAIALRSANFEKA